jgi:hypothetical protein
MLWRYTYICLARGRAGFAPNRKVLVCHNSILNTFKDKSHRKSHFIHTSLLNYAYRHSVKKASNPSSSYLMFRVNSRVKSK